MDKRDILVNLLGKETVSPAAKKAAGSIDDLGDEMRDTAKDAEKLDGEIDDLKKSLAGLAAAYAAASSAADRANIVKSIRVDERQLREKSKIAKVLADTGGDAAVGFSAQFVGRLGPLLARAPLSTPMVGALAAAAPVIASTVAGAVTAGVGLAAVGAGLAIAFSDPSVKAAAAGLKAQIGDELKDAAKPFVPATLNALGIVRGEFRKLKPVLDDVFADAAFYVAPLTRGIGGFAQELAPGIRNAVRNAEPLIDMLEDHIPRAGAAVSSVLTDLSSVSKESANTISAILTATEASIAGVGKGIKLLSEANKFLGSGPLKTFGDLVKDADDGTENWNQDLGKLNENLDGFRGKAYDAAAAGRDFATAMDQVHDNNLTAAEAVLSLKEALAEQKDVVDGKKGANADEERWLTELARRSNDATTALDAQGRSAKDAAAHHRQIRKDFINAAIAAGKTREAAEALADQYLNTPKRVDTKMNVNKQQAERDLNAINAKANNAARPRTIWFTVAQSGSLGAIGQREHGGPVKAGHAYVVGEKRPEVFVPDRDGKILPSVEEYTGRTAGAGGAARDTATPTTDMSAVVQELRQVGREVAGLRKDMHSLTVQLDDRRARLATVYARGG